ncbi:MAG TPA: DUF983 domain-containing protein [Ktedonobacteraceae bacterium]|nr:DUF983 domain-containing protein [Ktedonobacteraceae bacterium]
MTAGEHALLMLRRGLRQRCPVCGRGKIFVGFFKTYEHCPVCGYAFEREPGYYTGAMAVNLVVSELLIAIIAVPLAASQAVPVVDLIILGCTLPILLPVLFYRPTKSLWMSFDHFLHPANNDGS